MPHTLYVLKLKGGRWYVGSTGQPLRRRVEQHKRGIGSAWTRRHAVVRVADSQPVPEATAGLQEDLRVQELMMEHGIDKVRGGTYSRVVLPLDQLDELRRKIWHTQGRCCRCGRKGHYQTTCFARTTIDGDPPLFDGEEAAYNASESEGDDDGDPFCTRCGRTGHTRHACYARKGVDGAWL